MNDPDKCVRDRFPVYIEQKSRKNKKRRNELLTKTITFHRMHLWGAEHKTDETQTLQTKNPTKTEQSFKNKSINQSQRIVIWCIAKNKVKTTTQKQQQQQQKGKTKQ